MSTAVLPAGWEQRLRTWGNRSTGAVDATFLDPRDLALAKLVAYRDKDRDFVAALLDAHLLDARELHHRLAELPVRPEVRNRIAGFVRPWRGDDQGR